MARGIERLLFRRNLVLHSEIIKIGKTARGLGRVVEQSETVAHKMRNRIRHFQRLPDFGPRFTVEALKEMGNVGAVFEIAFGLEIHRRFVQRNALDFDGFARIGTDHDNGFAAIGHLHPHQTKILL